jgi:ribosomal protein S18 acetylase RimI-like enzyme
VVRDRLLIRPATPDDEAFARDCHHAAFRDVVERQFGPWDEERQDGFFDGWWGVDHVSIVEVDGERAGYLHVEERDDHVVLGEIVLHPDVQRRGIGTHLIVSLLDRGKPVQLQVLHENHGARALYERLGFAVTGRTATHHLMVRRVA